MKIRDLREYARQTNVRLIVGAALVLFVIGDGLIYWLYGSGAAVMGFLCLAAAVLPIILIALILWFMDWIVSRANRE